MNRQNENLISLECALFELEQFTGIDLSVAREASRIARSAISGNPIDLERLIELQNAERHNRSEGAPNGKFTRLRLVETGLGITASSFDTDLTF